MESDINKLTHEAINCAMEESNTIGARFTEKIYDNAMHVELGLRNIPYSSQKSINVFYNDHEVGHFVPDLLIDDKLIIELKAVESIVNEHPAQVQNYLKASGLKFGLMLNFGKPKLQIKRVIHD